MTPGQRKAKTHAILRTRGIPCLPWLPRIESENDTELRTSEEVGARMFCLFCVIGSAFYPSSTFYRDYLRDQKLWEHLTPEEVSFLSNPAPDRRSIINFTWRAEALFLLMWTVRVFRTLPLPTHQIPNEKIISKFPSLEQSPWTFIRKLRLRRKSEILDASDLIYRLHWATTQARVEGKPPPARLDPEVILEWHHAINWVTKYDDAEWDNVPVDT